MNLLMKKTSESNFSSIVNTRNSVESEYQLSQRERATISTPDLDLKIEFTGRNVAAKKAR